MENKFRKVNQGLHQRKDSFVKEFKDSFQLRQKYPDVIPFHMQSFEQENVYTIPNLLCLMRIAASPVLSYLIIHRQFVLAVGLAIAAAFTDLLDGYIARKFPGQASVFGSYLDPLADKISIATLFISLYYIKLIPGPLTAIVVTRDVLLFFAAAYVRYESLEPPRTWSNYFKVSRTSAQLSPLLISKINTALQFSLVATVLLSTVLTFNLEVFILGLSWCVAGTTFLSAVAYAITYYQKKK